MNGWPTTSAQNPERARIAARAAVGASRLMMTMIACRRAEAAAKARTQRTGSADWLGVDGAPLKVVLRSVPFGMKEA